METYPRQKLREILNDYSQTICDEPKRLKGLLRDYCPRYTRSQYLANGFGTKDSQRLTEQHPSTL